MAWLREHLAEIYAHAGLALCAVGAGFVSVAAGFFVAGVGLVYLAHRVTPLDTETTVTDTRIRRVV